MPNSLDHAKRWLQLISEQPLPLKEIFSSHLAAGEITSLCTCGCHGFSFTVVGDANILPLTKSAGLYCEIAFESDAAEEIDILLFTDNQGHFVGADVLYGPNIEPMPNKIAITNLKGVWSGNDLRDI